jgi:hypothetical protein
METIGGYNFGGRYHQVEMTVHRPRGLVLMGGNGVTWGESRQIPEKLSAQEYKYLDRGGGVGFLDGVPTAAVWATGRLPAILCTTIRAERC